MTKDAVPFVAPVAVEQASGMDFEKAEAIRRELGLDGLTVTLPPDFDDPAFSRQVLGSKSRGFCLTEITRLGRRWVQALSR